MASDELDKVELPALEQLQSLRWTYIEGSKLSPDESDERSSLKDVVLEKRLTTSLKRINPWINDENLRKVIRELTKTLYSNLVEANQGIWTHINQCISVMQDLGKGNKGQTVHIIDFEHPENNEFLCTNQFKVSGVNQNIIPDIILFVNGLPLAVLECKSPYITNPMEAGINQLLRYANRRAPENDEGAEKLFHYNLMMVSTHRDKARVGTITSRMEHYLEWKDPYPLTVEQVGSAEGSQDVLIAGLFTKANFLDILQNFTVFEPVDGRVIKKIPRYQQFRAVHKTIERLRTGTTAKDKSGVIWHTQGSGKSLTMVFLSIKMRRDANLRDYKLVFLTDRTQLDNQLTSTFTNTQGETIHHANSVKDLKEFLAKDSSDIVTAMVQKFQENADDLEFPVLNESDKIIVLADEAHRTQYGTLGAAINTALPNAPRIAFTGTPLIKSQKTTNTFGTYIDTYTIEQAVKDGATVQILYEGREAMLRVTGDSLDGLFDEYFADRSEDEKAAIKKKYGTQKAVLEAPQRIRRVCIDIIKHYREHIQPNGFKAMIVTSSRNAAIIYKEQLDKLGAPQSAAIISSDHNDEKRFWDYTDGTKHKKQIEDFKKPLGVGEGQSELSILVVKDMLLTGFDAPVAQVMYLDRKLTDHTLLQAIARVNRTNKNKFRGYIVDYFGLSDYLTEALEMFSSDDIKGALVKLIDELPKLKNAHTRVLKHFDGLDLNDLDACILSLEEEVKRQTFQTDFQIFSKQMDIILPDPAATPFIKDLRRLGRISVGARNLFRDEQLDIAGAGEKVRELIEEHVYSTGVDPKIPPADLLAGNYEEVLNQHKSSRSKASEIENAIKQHIKINIDEDPEYYKKLSERLKDIIRKHGEKWDELVQLLLDFRNDIEKERKQGAKEAGLTETEYAFFNILLAELEGEKTIDEAKVKDVVQSLVHMLDEATQIVDFFNKWDEQKRVRRDIKRIIIANFDESMVKPVSERFMELAKVKFG
ncbi:type I restriction endonuclease subunit R [Candidatus Persebacteraceae bacterium Df01]|jgi:type I restriction enzyme R subunit|uniref:Type I restriction enzyme endonuclease subunit n=1 Tax=Candidatus Doriopsillibacter californiensis TaxID=2970740 RepID=A0ABT7QNM8_9GAMM|nr:type I restriction endonuclease subunit R [Candidatus Persebacteraceae bacterium Df01]